MAPHSSTLAWKIPWTEEPGRLQSTGSQRVGHDCVSVGTPVFLVFTDDRQQVIRTSGLRLVGQGVQSPGGQEGWAPPVGAA